MDPKMDPRIARSVARMEEALDRPARIPELAAAVGLSESRFAHLFREQTGVPPARYLHGLRMQRARVLLQRTFLSVKDVMARVGFRDPSHFARDFRRYHGVPPSAARGAAGALSPGPTLEDPDDDRQRLVASASTLDYRFDPHE